MTDTEEPDRTGRHATPSGLVRPYVLHPAHGARLRQARRDADKRPTRGDQPAPDLTRDFGSRRTRDIPSEPTRRDGWTRPGAATAPQPASIPAGQPRALPDRWRRAYRLGLLSLPGAPAQLRWLGAIGAGVAGLAVAGTLIVLLSQTAPKLLASACEAKDCRHGATWIYGGVPPAAAAADNFQGRIRPTTHWTSQPANPASWGPAPNPTTSSPRPTPTAKAPGTTTPTPTPTSTPTSSPTRGPVQVSYSVVKRWKTGFHGQFIIVNKGSTAINGWQLVASLPDDSIHSVWKGQFHTDNDTLYIDPSSSQHRIAPGATVTENFTASGSTRTPTSCTFNGSAC